MKKPRVKLGWQTYFAGGLLILSAGLFGLNYAIFRDQRDLVFYLIFDLGFIPIQVLVVTLILENILEQREKELIREKLNMIVGAFFSEIGTKLLTRLSDWDPHLALIRGNLCALGNCSDSDFAAVNARLKKHGYRIDRGPADFRWLKELFRDKRDFLLRLMENPNILEHESFTNFLLAVFHLSEELEMREEIAALPESDLKHLTGDLERVYAALTAQWLDYMRHLRANYPFLFSLAMRTNPFDRSASAIVK